MIGYFTHPVELMGQHAQEIGRFNFFIENAVGGTLGELAQDLEGNLNSEDSMERFQLAKLLINIALYVRSQDPEILTLRPLAKLSNAERKKAQTGEHANLCTIPVKAINWDYKRLRQYEAKETFVDTFPRWQRCGVGLTQIKLVWVSEHVRKYHQN